MRSRQSRVPEREAGPGAGLRSTQTWVWDLPWFLTGVTSDRILSLSEHLSPALQMAMTYQRGGDCAVGPETGRGGGPPLPLLCLPRQGEGSGIN